MNQLLCSALLFPLSWNSDVMIAGTATTSWERGWGLEACIKHNNMKHGTCPGESILRLIIARGRHKFPNLFKPLFFRGSGGVFTSCGGILTPDWYSLPQGKKWKKLCSLFYKARHKFWWWYKYFTFYLMITWKIFWLINVYAVWNCGPRNSWKKHSL